MNDRVIYYVGISLDEASSRKLASHIQREGQRPLSSDFHCTVMYSRSWFTYKAADSRLPLVLEPPFDTTLFGSICVLLFVPPAEVLQRHRGLLAAGARYSYPDYHPHISLCKSALIPPPRFPITLAAEYYGTWKE
jgi:hypothetical protein